MERTKHKFAGRTYVGVDNGVTGSIGIVPFTGVGAEFHFTPTFSCLNYQKEAKNITRVDVVALEEILFPIPHPFAIIERPLVNPGMFSATLSAVRALEATLTVIDRLGIPYIYVDSRDWQKVMLPGGIKGDALKTASADIGRRLFPQFSHMFKQDADGMLIAEWGRRMRY